MARERFQQAKALIDTGNYKQARAILEGMDHPAAAQLLHRLGEIEAFETDDDIGALSADSGASSSSSSRLGLIVGVVILLVVIIAGILIVPGLLEDDGGSTTDVTNRMVATTEPTDDTAPPDAETESITNAITAVEGVVEVTSVQVTQGDTLIVEAQAHAEIDNVTQELADAVLAAVSPLFDEPFDLNLTLSDPEYLETYTWSGAAQAWQ